MNKTAYSNYWSIAPPNVIAREEGTDDRWLMLDAHRCLWRLRATGDPSMPIMIEKERACVPFDDELFAASAKTESIGIAPDYDTVTDERGETHRVMRPMRFEPR